ncbi:MAG: hypothetical protein ABIV36_24365 [Sphingobium limneticum]
MAAADNDSIIREMDPDPVVSDLIGRLGDRFGLKRYSRVPPDRSVDPIYVDEIDVTPAGGLMHNPDGPWIWCSECEKPKFWKGIAITNPDGDLFLIGETCARSFYGGDRVSAARNTWRADREHRRALARYEAVSAVAYSAMLDGRFAQWPAPPESLTAARCRLGAIGDLAFRLKAHLALEGGSIVIQDSFVDHQGKTQMRRRSLGRFKGIALLAPERTEVAAGKRLEAAAQAVLKAGDHTSLPTASLDRLSKAVVEAGRDLAATYAAANSAHQFFDADNLARLVEFADRFCGLRLQIEEDGSLTGPPALTIAPFGKLAVRHLTVDFDRLY